MEKESVGAAAQGTQGLELMGWSPYRRQRGVVADERGYQDGGCDAKTLVRQVQRLDRLRALQLLYGQRVAVEVHLCTWSVKVLAQCAWCTPVRWTSAYLRY